MSLKALLALGLGDTNNGVIGRSTRQIGSYGASKVAKSKLTVVLDDSVRWLYIVGSLRGLVAFPLYASLIRDQMGAANTARPVRLARLRDGRRLLGVAIPVAQLA